MAILNLQIFMRQKISLPGSCCRIPYQEDFLLPFFCSPSTLPLYFWPKYLEGEEGGSTLKKGLGPRAQATKGEGRKGKGV